MSVKCFFDQQTYTLRSSSTLVTWSHSIGRPRAVSHTKASATSEAAVTSRHRRLFLWGDGGFISWVGRAFLWVCMCPPVSEWVSGRRSGFLHDLKNMYPKWISSQCPSPNAVIRSGSGPPVLHRSCSLLVSRGWLKPREQISLYVARYTRPIKSLLLNRFCISHRINVDVDSKNDCSKSYRW